MSTAQCQTTFPLATRIPVPGLSVSSAQTDAAHTAVVTLLAFVVVVVVVVVVVAVVVVVVVTSHHSAAISPLPSSWSTIVRIQLSSKHLHHNNDTIQQDRALQVQKRNTLRSLQYSAACLSFLLHEINDV